MTDMYDEPKKFVGKLNPYPHEEKGRERGRVLNPDAYMKDVAQRAREREVAIQTVKLLRQRVIHCYRKEGVNHYENCKEVAQDYYDVIIKKDMGQLQPKWKDEKMNDGWS